MVTSLWGLLQVNMSLIIECLGGYWMMKSQISLNTHLPGTQAGYHC